MKLIVILVIANLLNASVTATQNLKALYKDVELNDAQKEYIINNQDTNIEIIQKTLEQEIKKLKVNYLDEKNIVSFMLTPDGETNKIKFLKKSNNRKLDKVTKEAIINASKNFVKPSEKTQIRFILSYNIGQKQNSIKNSKEKYFKNSETTRTKETYYIPISNGTTRFQHSSKEYVRVFETSRDGFVNASVSPSMCASFKLLTNQNQRVSTGVASWFFNTEIPKGKYKLLIKTKKVCDVSLQYL